MKHVDEDVCEECFGTKSRIVVRPVRFGHPLPPWQPCPACGGTGRKDWKPPDRGGS